MPIQLFVGVLCTKTNLGGEELFEQLVVLHRSCDISCTKLYFICAGVFQTFLWARHFLLALVCLFFLWSDLNLFLGSHVLRTYDSCCLCGCGVLS